LSPLLPWPLTLRISLPFFSQKLENSLLNSEEEKGLAVQAPAQDIGPVRLPSCIREIVTRNLSEPENPEAAQTPEMASLLTLQEENRILQQELSRLEDLLAQSRAERDELAIKYNAISERLEQSLRLESGEREPLGYGVLGQQTLELRRQLEEEQANYKRKLQAYQDGQQRQAQLVQKLQAKVLQYKKKCGEVEQQLLEKTAELEQQKLAVAVLSLLPPTLDLDLSASLVQVNAMLREQLDQASAANQALTDDIRKVTHDWTRSRGELEQREAEWRREEESFNAYFSNEHSRLLLLWRQVVGFRRLVSEMKTSTERDLAQLGIELARTSRSIHSASVGLSGSLRLAESSSEAAMEKAALLRAQLEEQLRDKVRDMIQLQVKSDLEKAELSSRVNELTLLVEQLQSQNSEKDRANEALTQKVEALVRTGSGRGGRAGGQAWLSFPGARAVLSDTDSGIQMGGMERTPEASDGSLRGLSSLRTPSPLRRSSPRPSGSPRPSLSPAFSDSTLALVHSALHKRQMQVQDMRGRYEASQDLLASLRKQLADGEAERRSLDKQVLQLRDAADGAVQAKEDALRDIQRLRSAHDLLSSEKDGLVRSLAATQMQVEMLQQEKEKLQLAQDELQRQKDQLEEEKEDITQDRERFHKEIERGHKQLEQLEVKKSGLMKELILAKETLSKATLAKEVMEAEKTEVTEALTKVEASRAELELSINKLKGEEASLRDSLSKLSALNEGLAQDKRELNQLVSQLEEERGILLGQKRDAEQEKAAAQEQVAQLEQEKLVQEAERQSLERSLQAAELAREALEQQLPAFQKERGQLQDQLAQLSRQLGAQQEELQRVHRDGERHSEGLERAFREMESLTKERASLLVQLTASERENRSLTEEVAGLRSEKDTLETSLFEAHRQLSQMEARREQLEADVQGLLLAKETLTGQLVGLRRQMETEVQKLGDKGLCQPGPGGEGGPFGRKADLGIGRRKVWEGRGPLTSTRALPLTHPPWRGSQSGILWAPPASAMPGNPLRVRPLSPPPQALSLKESEKTALSEKLLGTQQSLATMSMDLERQKRDALTRQEQDRVSGGAGPRSLLLIRPQSGGPREAVGEGLSGFRRGSHGLLRLLGNWGSHPQGAFHLGGWPDTQTDTQTGVERSEAGREQARDLGRQRESCLREVSGEPRYAAWRLGLGTALKSPFLLITHIRAGLGLALCPSPSQIPIPLLGSFPSMKLLDSDNAKKTQELVELQGRVALSQQLEKEARREAFGLKQKVLKGEVALDGTKQELLSVQRRLLEVEQGFQARERGLLGSLEESRGSEKKLLDNARNLELKLERTQAEAGELGLRLSAAEGRIQGLEMELARVEGQRREAEFQLTSLRSALRRTLGIGRVPSPAFRGYSPPEGSSCSSSPERTRHSCATSPEPMASPPPPTMDLDAETVRVALRQFLKELQDAQRERDELRVRVSTLNRQLADSERARDTANTHVEQLQKLVVECEEGRRGADGRLSGAQAALVLREESVRRSERERRAALDQVATLERSLQAAENERRASQEKISKMKANEAKLESDKRRLKEILDASESRATKLELLRHSLEGELQRSRLGMGDRESQAQALRDRAENLERQLADSELKAGALQLTVDRLNIALAKAEDSEAALKEKVQGLTASLAESTRSVTSAQDKNLHLQKSLTACEHDRRVLQERLDVARQATAEAKKQSSSLGEQVQTLRSERTELELQKADLEGQVQQLQELLDQRQESETTALQGLQKVKDEKQQLQECLASLQKSLAQLEGEKREAERSALRLEKDRAALKRTLDKVEREKLRSHEDSIRLNHEKGLLDRSLTGAEQELTEAQKQIHQLEGQCLLETGGQTQLELQQELERLRGAQAQAERTMEARERVHRQRIRGLEEHVSVAGAEAVIASLSLWPYYSDQQ
uniref:Ciliary rootlet coiled-coil, rootletin n=1 Tax=Sarcophilus harrisii TaxID=9305 RepID=G3W3J0_SARHA